MASHQQSPIGGVAGPDVEQLRWLRPTCYETNVLYHYTTPPDSSEHSLPRIFFRGGEHVSDSVTDKVFSRSYSYTVWSAIGVIMSSVRLPVCNAVHCGSQGRCTGIKVVPACSQHARFRLTSVTSYRCIHDCAMKRLIFSTLTFACLHVSKLCV